MRRLVGLERLHSQFWVVGFRVFVVLSDAWTGQNVVRVFVFARFRVFVSSCFRVLVLTLLTFSRFRVFVLSCYCAHVVNGILSSCCATPGPAGTFAFAISGCCPSCNRGVECIIYRRVFVVVNNIL